MKQTFVTNNTLKILALVALIVGCSALMLWQLLVLQQSLALQSVANNYNVNADRDSLREYLTPELTTRIGSTREEIHNYLSGFNEKIIYEDFPNSIERSERVTWVLAEQLGGVLYTTISWVLVGQVVWASPIKDEGGKIRERKLRRKGGT